MAAATVSAGAFLQVFCGWNAAKLERLGDVFLDGVLDFMKLFLRVKKTSRNRIGQQ